jgi:eukaryotic-like serine/threonine-protein kinase
MLTTIVKNKELINKRYELKQLIGKGGMGSVYQAQDKLLGGVPVAIKFLSQSIMEEEMKEFFANEARLCAALGNNSIHVVRVTDYGIYEEDSPYYVMEYLTGQSLKAILDIHPLNLSEFILITRQICLGLNVAHQGIEIEGKSYPVIHRDLKPANIFVSPDPSLGQLVKILDFGIAKFFSDHTCMTQTNTYIGTLAYSSPEQIEGTKLDIRSDIYSLGVMMYEMFTGKFPWDLTIPSFGAWYKAHIYEQPRCFSVVNSNLNCPKILEDLIMSCLAKEPNNRPANVQEILKVLALVQNSLTDHYASNNHKKTPYHGEDKNNFVPAKPEIKDTQKTTNKQTTTFSVPKYSLNPEEEKLCYFQTWSKKMPIAEIVMPNFIKNNQLILPSLWVMLPKNIIQEHSSSVTYNQFFFAPSPSPMVLWMTAVYNQNHEVKFFPCYLDLTQKTVRNMVYYLADKGYYGLIFFTLESPHNCINTRKIMISKMQRELFKKWLIQSQEQKSNSGADISKKFLKNEYPKIKGSILQKLELTNQSNRDNLEEKPSENTNLNYSSQSKTCETFEWLSSSISESNDS